MKQIKINKETKLIKNINKRKSNNTISLNNSINSIRNRYKQKSLLNNYNKSTNNLSKMETLNNKIINKNIVIVNESIKTSNNEIKNINISEDNWNINQIGEINIFKEINNIEFD